MKGPPKKTKELLHPALLQSSLLRDEIFFKADPRQYTNLNSPEDFFDQFCYENPLDVFKYIIEYDKND